MIQGVSITEINGTAEQFDITIQGREHYRIRYQSEITRIFQNADLIFETKGQVDPIQLVQTKEFFEYLDDKIDRVLKKISRET